MIQFFTTITILLFLLFINHKICLVQSSSSSSSSSNKPHQQHTIKLVDWKIDSASTEITVALFFCFTLLCKVIYHRLHFLSHYIPESCLLISIGLLFGIILKLISPTIANNFALTPKLFFLILLPPFIIQSSYSLHHSAFYNNIDIILLFAVVGTIISFLIIGIALFTLKEFGFYHYPNVQLNLLNLFLFASIIISVDPVAILSIFQEIKVDDVLYFMVFGESLLVDAVAIVLYDILHNLFHDAHEITNVDYLKFIGVFFLSSIGAILIGLFFGGLASILTRFTHGMNFIEPTILFTSAYLAYIFAMILSWSAIIAVIICGLVHAQYAFNNISWDSQLRIRTINKMMSHCSEAIIFLFLGMSVFVNEHLWCPNFLFSTLFFCFFSRLLIVVCLCTFLNEYRSGTNNNDKNKHQITFAQQAILIYGSLRGAVAFSLVTLLTLDDLKTKETQQLFMSTTLFIILITNFIMGITMKPIVYLFRIPSRQPTVSLNLFNEINITIAQELMFCIECICDITLSRHKIIHSVLKIDAHYIRPLLLSHYKPTYISQDVIRRYKDYCLSLHQVVFLGNKLDPCLEVVLTRANKKRSASFRKQFSKEVLATCTSIYSTTAYSTTAHSSLSQTATTTTSSSSNSNVMKLNNKQIFINVNNNDEDDDDDNSCVG